MQLVRSQHEDSEMALLRWWVCFSSAVCSGRQPLWLQLTARPDLSVIQQRWTARLCLSTQNHVHRAFQAAEDVYMSQASRLTAIITWVLRDYSAHIFKHIHGLSSCLDLANSGGSGGGIFDSGACVGKGACAADQFRQCPLLRCADC